MCPKCAVQNTYRFDGVHPMYSFVCPSCKAQFQSRIVTVRHKNSRLHQRSHVRRHISVRVYNALNREELIEFSGLHDFDLHSGDQAAFSYLGAKLIIVQNLTIGRYTRVGSGSSSCYIATYVYGPDSSEIALLCRFRDEVLLRSKLLSLLVPIYYFTSPIAIRLCGDGAWFRSVCVYGLAPIVRAIARYYRR